MKAKIYLTSLFFALACISNAQSTSWSKWSWLMGEWKGEGSGEPGKGSGGFSFKADLDNKILVRKNHSEYPAANGRPANVHDDLMIVYLDLSGDLSKAIYFDNEGHVINYSITYSDKNIILTSDKPTQGPMFRLTYTELDNKAVNIKFEIGNDAQSFKTYLEGKCIRTDK